MAAPLRGFGMACICDALPALWETDQSRIFDNAVFGYRKVAVERPLWIACGAPNLVCRSAAVKNRKDFGERNEDAAPIIGKTRSWGGAADPLRGPFSSMVDGRPVVMVYGSAAGLCDTEWIPL